MAVSREQPDDFEAFKADIAQHGVRSPVLLFKGKILDGQNRWRACRELGIKCPTKEWDGKDPWFLVQSMNLRRRHLNPDRITAIADQAALRFPELRIKVGTAKADAKARQKAAGKRGREGGRGKKKPFLPRGRKGLAESADAVGEIYGVSGRTVYRVAQAEKLGGPEALELIATGQATAVQVIREAKKGDEEEERNQHAAKAGWHQAEGHRPSDPPTGSETARDLGLPAGLCRPA